MIEYQADRPGRGVGVEAILLIVRQAVIGERVVAAEHHARARVVPDRRVINGPADRRVNVHDALVEVAAPGAEMLNGQVADSDVRRGVGKCVVVGTPSVQDRARGADVGRPAARADLRCTGQPRTCAHRKRTSRWRANGRNSDAALLPARTRIAPAGGDVGPPPRSALLPQTRTWCEERAAAGLAAAVACSVSSVRDGVRSHDMANRGGAGPELRRPVSRDRGRAG